MLVTVLVAIGAVLGRTIGGAGGFLIGCPLGLGVALIINEQIAGRQDVSGFWLRNRGAFLSMISAALCALVGEHITGGIWGFLGGLVAGSAAGGWLAGEIGWAGERLESELSFRAAFIQVLASAALIDGALTEKKRLIIEKVAREVLAPLGYGDSHDIAPLIDAAQREPASVSEAAEFAAACPPELQQALFYNVLSILYAEGSLSSTRRQWLEAFGSNITDTSLLLFFERIDLSGPEQRLQSLNELGLNETASEEEIHSAYRRRALEYHPDRHQGLPEHIRRLAEVKMAAISEAYRNLLNGSGTTPTRLYLRSADGTQSFCRERQDVVTCACWICGQKNRLRSETPTDSARCGQCHALLGVSFNPIEGMHSSESSAAASPGRSS